MRCPPLQTPDNAEKPVCSAEADTVDFGTMCKSECLPGFWRREGALEVVCMASGQWDDELSACVSDSQASGAVSGPRCSDWSTWSPCESCGRSGDGQRRRKRMCDPGMPDWESGLCRGCAECVDKATLFTATCECAGDDSDGFAIETYLCSDVDLPSGSVQWRRSARVPCRCEGCRSSPCLNGGRCMSVTPQREFMCDCASDFAGDYCETALTCEVKPSPCLNTGACVAVDNQMRCACPAWAAGSFCDAPLNCSRWITWGCASCGFAIETRLCYAGGSAHFHTQNVATDKENVRRMLVAIDAALSDTMPSGDDVTDCEWSEWSECERQPMVAAPVECERVRRLMCRAQEQGGGQGGWLPSQRLATTGCACPGKRLTLLKQWSAWHDCWPTVCDLPRFRRRQRQELDWRKGVVQRQNVVLEWHPCVVVPCPGPNTTAAAAAVAVATRSWRCEHGMCEPNLREVDRSSSSRHVDVIQFGNQTIVAVVVVVVGVVVFAIIWCLVCAMGRSKKRRRVVKPLIRWWCGTQRATPQQFDISCL